MADNVTLNNTSGGKVVATDEVTDGTLGTVQVQFMKLMDGTLDGTTKAVVSASNPIGTEGGLGVRIIGPQLSAARISSAAASTNLTQAKAAAGRLYAIQGYNASATVRYLRFWNKATSPAPATDFGLVIKSLAIPPGVAFAFDWPLGFPFSTGLWFGLLAGSSEADNTAVAAGDILSLNVDYV